MNKNTSKFVLINNSLKQLLINRLPSDASIIDFSDFKNLWNFHVDFPNRFTDFEVGFVEEKPWKFNVCLKNIRVPPTINKIGSANWRYLVSLGKFVGEMEDIGKEATRIICAIVAADK